MSVKKNNQKLHVASGLVVEKGIDPPTTRAKNPLTLVAKVLEIGDSVVLDKLPSSISATAKRLKIKFQSAKLADGKVRVWRIA